eukprot:357298-Chlamydomonas_euryale.AAC.3
MVLLCQHQHGSPTCACMILDVWGHWGGRGWAAACGRTHMLPPPPLPPTLPRLPAAGRRQRVRRAARPAAPTAPRNRPQRDAPKARPTGFQKLPVPPARTGGAAFGRADRPVERPWR